MRVPVWPKKKVERLHIDDGISLEHILTWCRELGANPVDVKVERACFTDQYDHVSLVYCTPEEQAKFDEAVVLYREEKDVYDEHVKFEEIRRLEAEIERLKR